MNPSSELKLIESENKKRICVIDDDMDVIFILKNYLSEQAEFSCYSWSKYEGFLGLLNFIQSQNFDLFIIDINLPGINGFQIGENIRSALGSNIPIVYISQDKEIKKKVYEKDDCSIFLRKPLNKDALFEAINDAFIFH